MFTTVPPGKIRRITVLSPGTPLSYTTVTVLPEALLSHIHILIKSMAAFLLKIAQAQVLS